MTAPKSPSAWRRAGGALIIGAVTTPLSVLAEPQTVAAATPVVELTMVASVDLGVDLAWRSADEALYVARQDGTVVRVDGDETTPVLDLTDLTEAIHEQGLLGLVFDSPGDLAYVNFTDLGGDTVVAELAVGEDGQFDRETMRTVLTVDQPGSNHNGGDLQFGPDGLLYIAMGDGGGDDGYLNAQDRSSLLGKLLRIDPTRSGDLGYTIPEDNPFVDAQNARGEIWAEGLRNPWRFSFDAVTGDLWIADVGQDHWEEIDFVTATDGDGAGRSANFGWAEFEGNDMLVDQTTIEEHTAPIYQYAHEGNRCSISGGTRPRGPGAGILEDWYLYADYCSGEVMGLPVSGDGAAVTVGTETVLAQTTVPTAVISGPDGTSYVLAGDGILRIDATAT